MGRTGSGSLGSRRGKRFVALAAAAAALAGLLAVGSVAGTSGSAGSPAPAGFVLTDGSIACRFADGAVTCAAAGASAGRRLTRDGDAGRVDDVTAAELRTTVALRPGERWVHGGLSCLAVRASVVCTAGSVPAAERVDADAERAGRLAARQQLLHPTPCLGIAQAA